MKPDKMESPRERREKEEEQKKFQKRANNLEQEQQQEEEEEEEEGMSWLRGKKASVRRRSIAAALLHGFVPETSARVLTQAAAQEQATCSALGLLAHQPPCSSQQTLLLSPDSSHTSSSVGGPTMLDLCLSSCDACFGGCPVRVPVLRPMTGRGCHEPPAGQACSCFGFDRAARQATTSTRTTPGGSF
ncbi:hypothetical protein CDD83_9593 [Cordyceps sp. RAO-2017]|nr:hypothetical protein CDD83_9593 [Cordyceps sp. RAO-2017]